MNDDMIHQEVELLRHERLRHLRFTERMAEEAGIDFAEFSEATEVLQEQLLEQVAQLRLAARRPPGWVPKVGDVVRREEEIAALPDGSVLASRGSLEGPRYSDPTAQNRVALAHAGAAGRWTLDGSERICTDGDLSYHANDAGGWTVLRVGFGATA